MLNGSNREQAGSMAGRIGLTVVTAAFVLFIFSNSLYSGEASSGQSGAVLHAVRQFFAGLGLEASVTEYAIRKLGHAAEYFTFGVLLLLTVRMYTRKPGRYIFLELFALCAVPVADEFIQSFVPGRGSNVSDVVLDFTAGLFGLLLVLLLVARIDRSKGRRRGRFYFK